MHATNLHGCQDDRLLPQMLLRHFTEDVSNAALRTVDEGLPRVRPSRPLVISSLRFGRFLVGFSVETEINVDNAMCQ